MTITLHAIADAPPETPVVDTVPAVDPCYFVIQRANGQWSPAAKILFVFQNEQDAERQALVMKRLHPGQHFGVALLRSEARENPEPFQIVRTN
jgi:hypothetical protein